MGAGMGKHARRLAVLATMTLAGNLGAQASVSVSVSERITAGDRAFAERFADSALVQYEAALASAPQDYGVLWRTSAALIDASEYRTDRDQRSAAFSRASALARQAVAINPTGVEGHFQLSRALGREALSVSARERTGYALDIRKEALAVLELDSLHAGAHHVLGRWHAEIMRLNRFTRMIARTFMGGDVFGEASWSEAVRLMERAVTLEPNRTVHLLVLGQVYRDAGEKTKARETLQAAIRAPLVDTNDEAYKREAARDLEELGG